MTKTGFLGRFQPFHQGHYKVIEEYKNRFDEFVIIVGSAEKSREQENPLNFEERKKLIQECFPEIEVLPLEDEEKTEEGNRKWVKKLQELGIDAVISRNDLVKKIVQQNQNIKLIEQELFDPNIYSGTEVRRRIRTGEEWSYLVPKCGKPKLEEIAPQIEETGIKYEFQPGWKKENIQ